DLETARELGRLIASEGWVLLTGGRASGVMDAASRGAAEAGGWVIGILPDSHKAGMSAHVDVPIVTGLDSARNNINVLSSDIVMVCGVGMGTFSEVLLAAKAGKPVVLLNQSEASTAFLEEFESGLFHFAAGPAEAIARARELL
ncbi:MAG: hypothetical protein R3224_07820, partial [Balneolaceae bacterium]|nr:hypothetical protein [Balneolaceae bacterium]